MSQDQRQAWRRALSARAKARRNRRRKRDPFRGRYAGVRVQPAETAQERRTAADPAQR